jgi:hypothetical protein
MTNADEAKVVQKLREVLTEIGRRRRIARIKQAKEDAAAPKDANPKRPNAA